MNFSTKKEKKFLSEKIINIEVDKNCKNSELESLLTKIRNIIKKRIKPFYLLICDDDFLNILAIQKYLKKIDLENNICFETAFNGKIALDKFKLNNFPGSKNYFDVVIMDCEMPIMDGFECSKELNNLIRKEKYQKCKIIGHSANKEDFEIKKCLMNGMIYFLEKPCPALKFFKIILKLVNGF